MANLLNGDGYAGITAQEDADLYAGLAGSGRLVLNVGRKMECEIINNNTVRIYDGELVTKGRRIHIDAGTWDEFTIPNGSQGETKFYTLGYRLYSNEGIQRCEKLIKSDSGNKYYAENDLRTGEAESYVSVYRIKQEGINLTDIEALYTSIVGIEDILSRIGGLEKKQTMLWSGTFWPSDTQTASFSGRVSEQKNGIVLVWSRYADGEGAKDDQFICSFVPKKIVAQKEGKGHTFTLFANSFSNVSAKYVYISDNRLTGHVNNTETGTSAIGLKYNNKYFCLRYVIGV